MGSRIKAKLILNSARWLHFFAPSTGGRGQSKQQNYMVLCFVTRCTLLNDQPNHVQQWTRDDDDDENYLHFALFFSRFDELSPVVCRFFPSLLCKKKPTIVVVSVSITNFALARTRFAIFWFSLFISLCLEISSTFDDSTALCSFGRERSECRQMAQGRVILPCKACTHEKARKRFF